MDAMELKIPPLALFILFAGAMIWFAPEQAMEGGLSYLAVAISVLLIFLGSACCLSGVYTFKRHKTTPDPRDPSKASEIVRTGIYAYSRNPMYLGFALLLCSIAVYYLSPILLLFVAVFVLYLNRFQIAAEERILLSRFGAHYQDYLHSVRRWF